MEIDKAALKDIIQWEVRSWSRALPFWEQHLPTERPLKALGIGEREGGLSLWFALKGIDVICTDLHPLPSATRELHQRYKPAGSISYATADGTDLPFEDGSFEIVFFKSVIGALGSKAKQKKAMEEINRVLTPGGKLMFAENLQGTKLHSWLRRKFIPWNTYWRYLHPIRDRDLFQNFSEFHECSIGLTANLGRTEAQRDLLARFDRAIGPIVPIGWREIWIGVAVK